MDPVAICNVALGLIGANKINTLVEADAASTEEELCSAIFGPLVKKVLEEKAWLFATGFYDLGAVAATPVGRAERPELPSRRALPADAVAVRACDDGSGDYTILWELEGRHVVSEQADKLYAVVTRYVEDPALWSPTFCMAVAFLLASDLAVPLAGPSKAGLADGLYLKYERELRKAATYDGMQGNTSGAAQVSAGSLAGRR